jgi:hypothetical protein
MISDHAGEEQDDPVGGEDALGAVRQVGRDAGAFHLVDDGGCEGPVEQEAGQCEEQDHPERQVRHDGREWAELWDHVVGADVANQQ